MAIVTTELAADVLQSLLDSIQHTYSVPDAVFFSLEDVTAKPQEIKDALALAILVLKRTEIRPRDE